MTKRPVANIAGTFPLGGYRIKPGEPMRSIREVGLQIGKADSTIRTMLREGTLPFVKLGHHVKIPQGAVDEYLQKQVRNSTAELSDAERGDRYAHLADARIKAVESRRAKALARKSESA